MRYVIIRDDDTNALTPIDCLETLYRPFLNKNLPINLAVIPDVNADARTFEGTLEEFLLYRSQFTNETSQAIPIGKNQDLVNYLKKNPGYHIAQHGCHHDYYEFMIDDQEEIRKRLKRGQDLFRQAGFPQPKTFVAPHDQLSLNAIYEVAKQYPIISTHWFQIERLPLKWWPQYLVKKMTGAPHWKVGHTLLLSHPPCYLAENKPLESMLQEIKLSIQQRPLTILITHWWAYFKIPKISQSFISILHELADYLSKDPHICVLSFEDLLKGSERLLHK